MLLLKPALPRTWLLFFSGLFWSVAGIMLCSQALRWSVLCGPVSIWWVSLAALCGVGVAYPLGFKRIALKNIGRIRVLPATSCVFAFQSWKSYLLIAGMISLGVLFEKVDLIPVDILASVYLIIGCSLFLSSLHFYAQIWKEPS